jgi:predicted nucleic acid-binding protein
VTLVDTSVWIEHFRRSDGWLLRLLADGSVLGHAFVTGEVACGHVPDRSGRLQLLQELPQARIAEPNEVLTFIERHGLAGAGIGYVDAHLLAAAALTPPARLWSGDRRLAERRGGWALGVQPDA